MEMNSHKTRKKTEGSNHFLFKMNMLNITWFNPYMVDLIKK